MRPVERAGCLAYTLLPVYQRRVERAREIIRQGLSRCTPYVAFSTGKDSSAMLWLALQERADLSARLLSSGETRHLHTNLDAILLWWREHWPRLDLQEINIDRVWSDEWQDATWTEQRKAGRGDIIRLLPDPERFDGVLLGLRDEESNARKMANRRGVIRRYSANRKDGLASQWVICPLAAWTEQDVAACITTYDIPLPEAYEAEGMSTRTTMRLTGDAVRQNAFIHLRMRDKARYNELLSRFPELQHWGG